MVKHPRKTTALPSKGPTRTFTIPNKLHRQSHNARLKSTLAAQKRSERFERKKAEDRDPSLREKRVKTSIPATIERKRVWDERVEGAIPGRREDMAVPVPKRRKQQQQQQQQEGDGDPAPEPAKVAETEPVPVPETPEAAEARILEEREKEQSAKADAEETASLFPTLTTPAAPTTDTDTDTDTPAPAPKILITTSRNCHVHAPAEDLTTLFPNSTYIPRGRGTKFSIREICTFASSPTSSARTPFTHVVVANEDRKLLNALTIIVLPAGPTFHFSLTNYTPARRIRGHGKPTAHIPELILNGFLTPLGRVTAGLFQSMFPRVPEVQGRQVVTLHNQRDWVFFRRHRYVFRDRRETEKPVGYGLEDGGKDGGNGSKGEQALMVKVGLQELGPRFTLKLRRVERGVKEGVEWEWKGGMDRNRKKFQL